MNRLNNKKVNIKNRVIVRKTQLAKYIQLQNTSNITVEVSFDGQPGSFYLSPGSIWNAKFRETPEISAKTSRSEGTLSVMEIY